MRINNNIMAMNTYRQLSIANNSSAKSMEKLSSGYRINRAGDDAAGLAISEKMRGQIRGLKTASRNAQDGISFIQTAEGALNETQAILQRMRELAVQAANDTNIAVDRNEIQKEIDQLASEITRISNTTEFNQQTLLNGGITEGNLGEVKFHIGANQGQDIRVSINAMDAKTLGVARDVVSGEYDSTNAAGLAGVKADSVDVEKTLNPGSYTVTVTQAYDPSYTVGTGNSVQVGEGFITGVATADTNITLTYSETQSATSASVTGAAYEAPNGSDAVLKLKIDGDPEITVTITDGSSITVAISAINDAINLAKGTSDVEYATVNSGAIVITSNSSGSGSSVEITQAAVGLSGSNTGIDAVYGWVGNSNEVFSGPTNEVNGMNIDITKLSSMAVGDQVTISTTLGNSMSVQLFDATGSNPIGSAVTIDAENGGEYIIGDAKGSGQLKVKFNAGEAKVGSSTVTVSVQSSTAAVKQADGTMSNAVAYGGINVSSQTAASEAITKIQKAIETVSAERSKLGAFQNRLEHTIKNLDTSSENLQAAESRIRDVDMAQEMMEYTKNSILQQAAQAMLAQANQVPQGVLQLLR